MAPELLGRTYGQKADVASARASTTERADVKIPYFGGAMGTAHVQFFVSDDTEDRGGVVLRLFIDDQGSSFVPTAQNLKDGVELHLAGEVEADAFLRAMAGVLTAFHGRSSHNSGC